MRLLRHLQHWLSGHGMCLQVAAFVPERHPIRQWADTFPWAALVKAVEESFARRFPTAASRGRPGVSPRVFLALDLLKHELGASDEPICQRLRTDCAVLYACGIEAVPWACPPAHVVLPETLAPFRSRLEDALMDARLAIQAAAAMEAGLVSPAHLLVETFPREHGSQRVTDATTLSRAQKKASSSSCKSPHTPRAKRAC